MSKEKDLIKALRRSLKENIKIVTFKVCRPTNYPNDNWEYNKGWKNALEAVLDDPIFDCLKEE